MHISLGRPLTSAEHEPHFPALQFQRTARSGACSAWILWTASSTTMPSPASTAYSFSSPELRVPRKIRNRRCSLTSRPFLNQLGEVGRQLGLSFPADRHPVRVAPHHDLTALLLGVRGGVIAARVGATTLGALERSAGGHLRHREQGAQVERGVPPRGVLPAARDAHGAGALGEPLQGRARLLPVPAGAPHPRPSP